MFWLNARDETTLRQGFARVAERILDEHPLVVDIDNAVRSSDLDQAVRAVRRWLDQPGNHGWLLIFDNYDNPALRGNGDGRLLERLGGGLEGDGDVNAVPQGYDIRPFFPGVYHGAVIITTRSSNIMIGRRIALGKLKDANDSLAILAYTSKRQNVHGGMWLLAYVQHTTPMHGLQMPMP